MTFSPRWVRLDSPTGRDASCWPRARRCASVETTLAMSSPPGRADRETCPRRSHEPGDWCGAVHQPPHRGVAPAAGLLEARDQLPEGPPRRAAEPLPGNDARVIVGTLRVPTRQAGARVSTRGWTRASPGCESRAPSATWVSLNRGSRARASTAICMKKGNAMIAAYIIKQYERAVVFKLGKVNDEPRGPGLIFVARSRSEFVAFRCES